MKKVRSFVVRIVLMLMSFMAGAIWIHGWWAYPSSDGEFNKTKDEICKKHNITLVYEDKNLYGKKRDIVMNKKPIHIMNRIGF